MHNNLFIHMVICDGIYLIKLTEGQNIGNPRSFEPYFECTKVSLELGIGLNYIVVLLKILLRSSNVIDHIRSNNMVERRADVELYIVGSKIFFFDTTVLV